MSSNLENETWLWTKGGLLLLLGVASASLLILQHPDVSTLVLLFVIVWSFCRAYHHAFYITEHYVDPGFRYMGLASFWDYMVDQSHRPANSEQPLRYSRDEISRDNYQIKSMMLNWIAFGILGCFFLPTIYVDLMKLVSSSLSARSELFVLLQMVAIGSGSSLYAALGVFAGLASWSFRYRAPVALTLLSIFCSSQFLGSQDEGIEKVIGCFVLPVADFLITFGMCWTARILLGWRLIPRSALVSASDKARRDSQWGIAYLFLLSAIVAICVSLVSSILPRTAANEVQSLFRSAELLFGVAQLVELAMVTNCAVFLLLASRLTLPGKWTAACCVLAIAIGPVALPLMLSISLGNFSTLFVNVRASYAFQIGLLVGLSLFFVSARFAKVRLLDRPN